MKEKSNRRDFIKTSSAAAVAAGSITFPTVTFGKPDSRKLKIGFIGCGGRGTGAASSEDGAAGYDTSAPIATTTASAVLSVIGGEELL